MPSEIPRGNTTVLRSSGLVGDVEESLAGRMLNAGMDVPFGPPIDPEAVNQINGSSRYPLLSSVSTGPEGRASRPRVSISSLFERVQHFCLTHVLLPYKVLNMFNTERSEASRKRILQTALSLFRKQGFTQTTMREVASEAGVSLGAAYYYFQSKEDIVGAYYEYVQKEHRLRARKGFRSARTLKQRLEAVLFSKMDIVGRDQRLLSALFRYGGDPDHPLCWFGPETERQRDLSMALFDEALGDVRLSDEMRNVIPILLWAMHMGLMLYLLFDRSPNQRRTHMLTARSVELSLLGLKFLRVPLLRAPVRKAVAALKEAELIPPASRWREAIAQEDTEPTGLANHRKGGER